MKKFAVFLIVVILLGGAGFLAGWTGFALPLGSVGVLRSKTHGVAPEVIREGEVRWVWYRLIPANAKVLPFMLKPVNGVVEASGSLAQGDVYRRFAGQGARFSWKLTCNYTFMLNDTSLPALVAEKNITNTEELDQYLAGIAVNLENMVQNYEITREIFEKSASPSIEAAIHAAFPEITGLNLLWETVEAPDFALYETGKAMYQDYLARQQALLGPDLAGEAARNITSQFRFDELERYGELLTKYPSLLPYLQMETR